jgi:hypothetical protein
MRSLWKARHVYHPQEAGAFCRYLWVGPNDRVAGGNGFVRVWDGLYCEKRQVHCISQHHECFGKYVIARVEAARKRHKKKVTKHGEKIR